MLMNNADDAVGSTGNVLNNDNAVNGAGNTVNINNTMNNNTVNNANNVDAMNGNNAINSAESVVNNSVAELGDAKKTKSQKKHFFIFGKTKTVKENRGQTQEDSVFGVFDKNVMKQVDYDQNLARQQINMNPTEKQRFEPLTGSSVVIDTSIEKQIPENGFPAGYGPNANIARVEKPKKPKLKERLKRSFAQMTKRQRRLSIIVPSSVVVLLTTFSIVAMITGMFATDYSKTYSIAKTLKIELQKMRSNVDCNKVTEYASNTFTSMEIYQGYVEECKKNSKGIDEKIITEMGDTAGVLKNIEVNRRFESFKVTLNEIKMGNTEIEKKLDIYTLWHNFVLEESSGDKAHNGYEWSEAEIQEVAKKLIDSGNEKLVNYGKKWAELKIEVAKAAYKFYHTSEETEVVDYKEIKNEMENKKTAFSDFQKAYRPDPAIDFPLQFVDVAKLYVKFEEMYNFIRETYQKNYNRKVGGCKELINAIVCD